jgi:hypothetical protein
MKIWQPSTSHEAHLLRQSARHVNEPRWIINGIGASMLAAMAAGNVALVAADGGLLLTTGNNVLMLVNFLYGSRLPDPHKILQGAGGRTGFVRLVPAKPYRSDSGDVGSSARLSASALCSQPRHPGLSGLDRTCKNALAAAKRKCALDYGAGAFSAHVLYFGAPDCQPWSRTTVYSCC